MDSIFGNSIIKKNNNKYIDYSWIAASRTRNASLNDHFIDYCNEYNVNDVNDKPRKRKRNYNLFGTNKPIKRIKKDNFLNHILNSGNTFEDKIIIQLKSKFKNHIFEICEPYESRNINNYYKTVQKMEEGIPIIYQAVLYNFKNKIFGCADLIVRSDWINKLTNIKSLDDDEINIKSSKLGIKYHYRVIDIKNHRLKFNVDNLTIRNNHSIKPFKTQITLYNIAIGEMQGYIPNKCYILGNGWIVNKTVNKRKIVLKSDNPFDRLGIIDLDKKDKSYNKLSLENINWLNKLYNSKNWTHNPPSNNYIYPNMCNKLNGNYYNLKKTVAKKLNEITLIWNCSYQNRLNAFNNGITSWKDERCTSKMLGIKGKVTSKKIDEMLNFHRSAKKISINKIKNNNSNWKNQNKCTVYIDFETISNFLLKSDNKSNIKDNDFIFMVGIGWQLPNCDKWNFKCLYANEIKLPEEERIMNEMNVILRDLEKRFGISNVVHWSNAEPVIYNKVIKKYNLDNIRWFDLMTFFKNNKILIKDCFNFGLKSVATKMSDYKMIKTNWNNNKFSNGLDAMYNSWKSYINNSNINESLKEVIEYNEIDCKTMFEILNYFRLENQ